jgi:hypothetical protein
MPQTTGTQDSSDSCNVLAVDATQTDVTAKCTQCYSEFRDSPLAVPLRPQVKQAH